MVIGDGAADLAGRRRARPSCRGPARAAVVTQPGIGVEVDPGLPVEVVHRRPTARRPRRSPRWSELCRAFARSGLSRSDVVVAVGGGVVTDLAGFAAATLSTGAPPT